MVEVLAFNRERRAVRVERAPRHPYWLTEIADTSPAGMELFLQGLPEDTECISVLGTSRPGLEAMVRKDTADPVSYGILATQGSAASMPESMLPIDDELLLVTYFFPQEPKDAPPLEVYERGRVEEIIHKLDSRVVTRSGYASRAYVNRMFAVALQEPEQRDATLTHFLPGYPQARGGTTKTIYAHVCVEVPESGLQVAIVSAHRPFRYPIFGGPQK